MRRIFSVLCLFYICSVLFEINFISDVFAEISEEREVAFEELKEQAASGDVEAQLNLGKFYYFGKVVYYHGEGIIPKLKEEYLNLAIAGFFPEALLDIKGEGDSQNFTKAATWFEAAAIQNNAESEFFLGLMNLRNEIDQSDFAKTLEWFEKSADHGDVLAQYALGEIYSTDGFTYDYNDDKSSWNKNFKTAFTWYKKAAIQGHAWAQYQLGEMYFKGQGVSQNYNQAYAWFSIAVYNNIASNYVVSVKDKVATKLSPKEIRKAEIMAKEYLTHIDNKTEEAKQKTYIELKEKAEAGDHYAQYRLGWIYYEGYGVPADPMNALFWFEKSADQGDPYAQYQLGEIYQFGDNVSIDLDKAFEWYEKAAKQSNDYAQWRLGDMYYNGIGVTQDDTKAYAWFSTSTLLDALLNKNSIALTLSPKELEEADKLANEYIEKFKKK